MAHLLQHLLRQPAGQRQSAQQRFVLRGQIRKLPRAAGRLPTTTAQFGLGPNAKPVFCGPAIVAQPRRRFTLRAGRLIPRHIGWHQFHVTPQLGQDSHLPTLPTLLFGCRRQIPHVRHDQRRTPIPLLLAMVQAGNQQPALGKVGRRHPTDERHQLNSDSITVQPEAEGVLFKADETSALSHLEGSSTQGRACGRVLPGGFF